MTGTLARWGGRPGFWLSLFAAYFAAQAVLRITLGDRFNIDEAEAWLWAQHLDWGYGPQPPLYIWLQGAVFAVTGPGAAGLAVMKALVLWSISACGFALARRWLASEQVALAGIATLALIWLPELSWESQRIRTHNTLAALIALGAVLVVLRLRADPRGRNFAVLGALFGLGLLAKWNFVTLIPALLGALMLAPGGQRSLARPAALWLVALPLVLIAPTGLWMMQHPDIAFASMGKLGIAANEGPAAMLWLGAFASNLAEFAALPVLVLTGFALAGRRRDIALSPEGRAEMTLVLRAGLIALGFVLIGGLTSGATQMTSRWFLPLALPLMPLAGVWTAARLGRRTRITFVALSAALATLLLIAIGAMLTRDPPLPGVPLDAMAAALLQTPPGTAILAPVALAANLQARASDHRITDAALLLAAPCPEALWVLETTEAPHPGLAGYLAHCGLAPAEPGRPLLSGRMERIAPYAR